MFQEICLMKIFWKIIRNIYIFGSYIYSSRIHSLNQPRPWSGVRDLGGANGVAQDESLKWGPRQRRHNSLCLKHDGRNVNVAGGIVYPG
jgi:hypothetical protein